jgi:hypothetical protein
MLKRFDDKAEGIAPNVKSSDLPMANNRPLAARILMDSVHRKLAPNRAVTTCTGGMPPTGAAARSPGHLEILRLALALTPPCGS